MRRIPRAAGLLVWAVGAVAVHAVVPFELSRLADRVGRPGRATATAAVRRGPAMRSRGLLTVAAGAALMAWAFAAHYQATPRGWVVESRLTPEYLLRRGPYRLGRNPMYLGEAVVWLGWALFYGSLAVWAGLAIMCAAFAGIVRWEERRLIDRFCEDYRTYLAEVPRWLPHLHGGGLMRRVGGEPGKSGSGS